MNDKSYGLLKEAEKFGTKKQKDGTLLFGHIPHVAPEAWFHILFAPLAEKEGQLLEKNLKKNIPKPYKDFLSVHNGLILFAGSLSLDGYKKSYDRTAIDLTPFDLLTVNVYERPDDSLNSHFFIGGYDWDGSLLYLDEKSPKIFRCSRDTVEPLNAWSNLSAMLDQEIVRLSKLFVLGKKNKEEQSTTP